MHKNTYPKTRLQDLETGYKRLLEHLLKSQQQSFSSDYARAEFIIDHYHLPVYLRAQVRHLGFLFTKAKKGKEVTEEHVGKAAKILCYLTDFFAEGLTPESLLESLENVDLPVTAIPESKPEAKTDTPPLKAINGNHQGLDSFLPAPAENREKTTSALIRETKAYLSGVDNALTRIMGSRQTIFLAAKTVSVNYKDVEETAMVKWVIDRLWPCFEHATEMTKHNAIGVASPFQEDISPLIGQLSDRQQNYIRDDWPEKPPRAQVLILPLISSDTDQYPQALEKLDELLNQDECYTILIGCPERLSASDVFRPLLRKYYQMKAVYKIRSGTRTKSQQ